MPGRRCGRGRICARVEERSEALAGCLARDGGVERRSCGWVVGAVVGGYDGGRSRGWGRGWAIWSYGKRLSACGLMQSKQCTCKPSELFQPRCTLVREQSSMHPPIPLLAETHAPGQVVIRIVGDAGINGGSRAWRIGCQATAARSGRQRGATRGDLQRGQRLLGGVCGWTMS